jgi:hypothetical protein
MQLTMNIDPSERDFMEGLPSHVPLTNADLMASGSGSRGNHKTHCAYSLVRGIVESVAYRPGLRYASHICG